MSSHDLTNPFLGAVHREAISDQITDRILLLIRERRLQPGDKLPPERDLAVSLGVSRATLREALRSLAMMNVVELKHGSGTYVTSLEPNLLVENFALVFSLTQHSFLQLVEARKVIEPGTTALVAQHITDDGILQLEKILQRSRDCLQTHPEDFPELDIEFHVKIAEFSGNALLSRIMQALTRMSIASSQRTASSDIGYSVHRIERAIRMHEGILDAIKAHDPIMASQRMTDHLMSVEDTLRGDIPD
ncbi:MAG: FadR/GntR family transcriptional regulator [Phototrophicales bacterium]|nr:FadR/GntR family transcriptional regulator [Phototrophicales bacterium]